MVDSKGAMAILKIGRTALRNYELAGLIRAYRPFSNRKWFKVSELEEAMSRIN